MKNKKYIEGWIIKFFPFRTDNKRYNFINIDDSKSTPEIIECVVLLLNNNGDTFN